ncbi:hypothetical protein [Fusobacterium pseudoperiodonticum]|uniref:hypothetical protein n=1 Tax=Fusobacterium pseudoperiodonticum TaxID=2663009 RepID=UPI000C1C19F0|nr:hypothetical protein [Fusobacterium pseudoperiodonticum]ATV63212.1 hypothetical protein CTM78_01630 [Fusobacterium pseudoperiodonticum]
MSILEESKKIKKPIKKDKEINDLTKNTKPLNEGVIVGFDTFDTSKLKNNVKVMNESYDATKEQEKKKK